MQVRDGTNGVMQIKILLSGTADVREFGKVSRDPTQMFDLLDQGRRNLGCQLWNLRGILMNGFLQVLDAQFHGGQRILDLMGDLPGHFAPGSLPFRTGECSSTFLEFPDHTVVLGHEYTDLILPMPCDLLVVLGQTDLLHFSADPGKRPGQPLGEQHGDDAPDQEYKGVQIDQGHEEAGDLLLQTTGRCEIWNVHIGAQFPLSVPERRVDADVFQLPVAFLLHELHAPSALHLPVGHRIHLATENAFVVHERLRRDPEVSQVIVQVHICIVYCG